MHLISYCFHVFTKQCAKIKLPYDFRYVYYGFTNDNIQWMLYGTPDIRAP